MTEQLDERVAELMGYVTGYPRATWGDDNADDYPWWCVEIDKTLKRICSKSSWQPSERIEQAWMVEEKIYELGLETKYMRALMKIVHGESVTGMNDLTVRGLWFLIHATPEQRCLAALKANRWAA